MAWLSRIRRMSLSLLAALSLSLWAGCPRTALAQEPHAGALVAADPALVPVGAPGFVRLTACTVTATLTEEGGRLLLSVDQTYALHNRDRIEPATLQVGLVPPGGIAAADVAAEVSRDGGELARLETPAGTAGAWQLTWPPMRAACCGPPPATRRPTPSGCAGPGRLMPWPSGARPTGCVSNCGCPRSSGMMTWPRWPQPTPPLTGIPWPGNTKGRAARNLWR